MREMQSRKVVMSLSYPMNAHHGGRVQFAIRDAVSRLPLAEIELDPEGFYKLMSGLSDGTPLDARLADISTYQYIGNRLRLWVCRVTDTTPASWQDRKDRSAEVAAWAEEVRARLELHHVRVDSKRGGHDITWRAWSNSITDQQHAEIEKEIDAAADRAGFRATW